MTAPTARPDGSKWTPHAVDRSSPCSPPGPWPLAAAVVCDGCPGVAQAAGASFKAARPELRPAPPPSAARVSSACSGLNGDSGLLLALEGRPLAKTCTFLSYDAIRELAALPHLAHLSDSILSEYEETADE